jgi:hypothetical protein
VATALANAITNSWCLFAVKKSLGLFPYNRTYWMLLVPSLVTVGAAIGLRLGSRSFSADIPVVIASTVTVYGCFIGTALLLGLNADDRLIANSIWSRIRTGSVLFAARNSE